MATVGAIAAMNADAFKRIYRVMTEFNAAYPEVEPITLPTAKDPRYQEAIRNLALAEWVERLAGAMGVIVPAEITFAQADNEPVDTIAENEPEAPLKKRSGK